MENHYRPELHYMRGPGPKSLEKNADPSGSNGVIPGESDRELSKTKGWREAVLARLKALNAVNQ
jgi:hypothetical protein